MQCRNCGSPLKEGVAFCSQCGFRNEPAPASPPPAAPAPQPAAAPAASSFGPGEGQGFRIEMRPAFSILTVYLQPEQSIQAEAGAMVAMSAHVDLQSQMKGGLMGALKRTVTGESVFQNTYTANGAPGEVLFAPSMPGDIIQLDLRGQTFLVQSSSYLAGDTSLTMDTKWGGMKTFFSREGLFMIQMSGNGRLFLSSFGAIMKKTLAPGERYVVDTGHLVAFQNTIQYTLRKASSQGWLRSMVGGEGIVAEYTGPGDLYLQTRNVEAFAGWIAPFFPKQSGGSSGFSINLGGS